MNINPFSNFLSDGSSQCDSTNYPKVTDPSEIVICAITILGAIGHLGAFYVYGRLTSSAEKLPWFNLAWEGTFDPNHTGVGKRISPFGGICSGTFVNGKLHGQGKVEDSICGMIMEGQFENDKLIEGERILINEEITVHVSRENGMGQEFYGFHPFF
jgi:hypothetical protein